VDRIEAEYRDGVLHPTTPIPLRPGERVQLIVVRKADPRRWDASRLSKLGSEDGALAEEGLAEWADELDRFDRR
jgi:predicted DNA-binding antitoxin AbrB/MazE fold protein